MDQYEGIVLLVGGDMNTSTTCDNDGCDSWCEGSSCEAGQCDQEG